jgi:hypothetical protein
LIEEKETPIQVANNSIVNKKDSFIYLLMPSGENRAVQLIDIKYFKFSNLEMQNEFKRLLNKIWKNRKPEGKIPDGKININFTLSPQEYHEEDVLCVNHIDKTSEWKCLYRLELKSFFFNFSFYFNFH